MEHFKVLGKSIMENGLLVLGFLGVVLLTVLIAYVLEKIGRKIANDRERILNTRTIATVGMFAAISGILMTFEVPLPFIAPEFYGLDLSELPALLVGFVYGPVAGVLVEFIKLPIKLLIKPSSTALIGEMANYVVGCSMILPATIIYRFGKSRKSAMIGCGVGVILMTAVGSAMNAYILLPVFAKMFFGGDLPGIIALGTKINPAITNIQTFAFFAVAPMNLIKSLIAAIFTIILYKPLSPLMQSKNRNKDKKKAA